MVLVCSGVLGDEADMDGVWSLRGRGVRAHPGADEGLGRILHCIRDLPSQPALIAAVADVAADSLPGWSEA